MRQEVLRKKEENRLKAAKEKEAEIAAKSAARSPMKRPAREMAGNCPAAAAESRTLDAARRHHDSRQQQPQQQNPPPQLPTPHQQARHPHPPQRQHLPHQRKTADEVLKEDHSAKTSRLKSNGLSHDESSSATSASDQMTLQRRRILDDLRLKTKDCGNDAAAPVAVRPPATAPTATRAVASAPAASAPTALVPTTLLAHAVLSAPAPTTTTKKVAVIKKRKIQAPVEEHPIPGGPEQSRDIPTLESASLSRHRQLDRFKKPDLPSPLRPKAPSGPKPSLPDLPLPAVDDVSMSLTEKEAKKDQAERRKNKKKVVTHFDAATGIYTTADGWKLRAKMIKVKTADGGERVVKKFAKLDDDQLRLLHGQASQPQTPNTVTQSDDLLALKANVSKPSTGKLERTISTPSSPSSRGEETKQPLSMRFNRLQRPPAPGPETTSPPPEANTSFVILSNLGSTINDLKIKDLCNRVGPIFSIQYRKSEGKACVKFKNQDDARKFESQYDSRIFENQRIKVHLRGAPQR